MPPRKKAGPDRGRRGQGQAADAPVEVQTVTDDLYTSSPDGFQADFGTGAAQLAGEVAARLCQKVPAAEVAVVDIDDHGNVDGPPAPHRHWPRCRDCRAARRPSRRRGS